MASFVHMADVHLGFDQYQLTERFIDFGTAFRSAAAEAMKRDVDFVLIAGDLFNKRAINARTLIQAKKVLQSLKDAGIPVVVIEGNHDMSYYRDMESWLSYLRHDGLIILLEPTTGVDATVAATAAVTTATTTAAAAAAAGGAGDVESVADTGDAVDTGEAGNAEAAAEDEGKITFIEWDPKRRRGGFIEIGEVRIFGMGWQGASTETLAGSAAASIERITRERGKKFNILMMHAGLEGYVPRMSGCIDAGSLVPLRNCVDYLALGHIHKGYERDGWAYNPGSLETWNIQEYSWKRGLLHVKCSPDGIDDVACLDGSAWRRPFRLWEISLNAAGSKDEAMKAVFDFIDSRAGSGSKGSPIKCVSDDSVAPPEMRENIAEMQGTIDSFFPGKTDHAAQTANDGIPHATNTNPAAATTSATPAAASDVGDAGGNIQVASGSTLKPVIRLTLTGVLGFDRHQLDTDAIRDYVMRRLGPLHVLIKNDLRSPDFDFEVDPDREIAREELELEVVKSLIGNDERFSGAADSLARLIIDLKDNPDRPPENVIEEIRIWAEEHSMMDTIPAPGAADGDKTSDKAKN